MHRCTVISSKKVPIAQLYQQLTSCLTRLPIHREHLRDGGWMGEGRPEGGHALAILPGLTHYNIANSPLFAAATLAFLEEQPA